MSEPVTERGRRLVQRYAHLIDYDIRDEFVASVASVEAALLAPDGGLRKAAAAMFDQHGNFVSTGAHIHLLRKALDREAALLARRAPGDRRWPSPEDEAAVRLLAETLHRVQVAPDRTGGYPLEPCAGGCFLDAREVLRALAADSRPEWTAPKGSTLTDAEQRQLRATLADSRLEQPRAECGASADDSDGHHVCRYPRGHRPGDGHGHDYLLDPEHTDRHWCEGVSGHTSVPFGHWFTAPEARSDG